MYTLQRWCEPRRERNMMKGEKINRQLKGGVIIDGKHIKTELLKEDKKLLWEINDVFHNHGYDGRIKQLVFVECGTPPPRPRGEPNCHKVCYSGPDDKLICYWICD